MFYQRKKITTSQVLYMDIIYTFRINNYDKLCVEQDEKKTKTKIFFSRSL